MANTCKNANLILLAYVLHQVLLCAGRDSAALMVLDVSQQWTTPNADSLLPSWWNDLELAKNKGLDNDDLLVGGSLR
jgi:hypothetical protein